jgi:hypothetical protein
MTAGNFITALHEDMDRITEIVRDDMEDSNSFVMGKIPDGGDAIHNDQHDSIEYTAAKPAFIGYRDVDATPRALIPGSMEAQACTGFNKSFATNVNDQDPNACGGLCEFKFGQGYRIYSTSDYELPMTTPEVCANHFIRQGAAHVDGYFAGLFESYRKYGVENFEAELQNRVIEFGEANASIVAANHFQLTKGGFHAPPQSRMTIHFLMEYRNYMEYEGALTPEGYLEIEMPRQDWFDAVTEHQVRKNSMGGYTSFNTDILKDQTAELWGRDFHVFENIKCYFNERPVRGYFKPNGNVGGSTQYSFVRVFPWVNVVNEVGGVSAEPNHTYNKSFTYCEGVKYPMVTLAFHIHNTAFKRYRLKEADKKAGDANVPTNFSMVIRDGAYIKNNALNDKFFIVSRHAYRLKQWKLERAGAIAYRHSRPEGYIITPTDPEADVVPEQFSTPQEFAKCLPTADEAANCAACDQVVNDNGDCVDTPGAAVVNFTPSGGQVLTVNDGTAQVVTIRFDRTGTFNGVSTVAWALTELGDAVAGTNYDDTPASGVVTFPDGDTSPQYVEVTILTGAGLDGLTDGVRLTASSPGGSLTPTLADTTVDIIIVDATE